MSEILASLQDINTHLPPNVQINADVDDGLQVDAYRLIRGQLVGSFGAVITSSWDSPENTPQLIRGIAGRLIASKFYAKLMAGETSDEFPDYAVDLYREAIKLLADIRAGVLIVTDDNGQPIEMENEIDSDPALDTFPTDDSPVFSMGQILS